MVASEPRLRFAVLGPVRAWRAEAELDLGPPTQRAMLAALLARVGQPVSVSELVDVLWGADPPFSAVNIIHRHVGALRRLFEPELPHRAAGRWLVRGGAGYRLDADPVSVDLLRFRLRGEQARASAHPECGADLMAEALAEWRGPAACDVEPHVRSHPIFTALDWEYLAAIREFADTALGAGRAELAHPVVRLAAGTHPLDESVQARLVLLLAAAGQRSEALDTFRAVRERLADELGVDPGPDLRAAHHRVLNEDVAGQPPSQRAASPAQLPAGLSTFIGREREISDSLAPLAGTGSRSTVVITAISGMAGIGKTTLAVHWAHQVAGLFPDGQLYVNLRGFDPAGATTSTAEALRGFLEAFGVPPQSIPAGIDARAAIYRSTLAGRRVLVVLDNARDADQVRPLLPGAPGCLVIVTSRDRLAGLAATEGAASLTLDLCPTETARAFLIRRLGAGRIGAEPAAVAEIVEHCAGLPLALAIVAARATGNPRFSLTAIAAELRAAHGSLAAFAGAGAAVDARAVFSWSYRTLGADAARVFRLLALYPGATAGAADASSLAGIPVQQARTALAELSATQLITEPGPGRYAYHDLLRAYAAELAAAEDTEQVHRDAARRLLGHYVHSGETLSDPVARAHSHRLLGLTDSRAGRFDDSRSHLRQALDLFEALGDRGEQAATRRQLATVLIEQGRFREALRQAEIALDLFRRARDRFGEGNALNDAGHLRAMLGDYTRGLADCRSALDLIRELGGHRRSESAVWDNLGYIHHRIGDHREAVACYRRAAELRQVDGDPHAEAITLGRLGDVHHTAGASDDARATWQRALSILDALASPDAEQIRAKLRQK